MADEVTTTDVEIHSVLTSTKKFIGPSADYDAFDHEILVSINSAFSTLYSVCKLGGEKPLKINGPDEEWEDLGIDEVCLDLVKDYVWKKVRLSFDPPNNSFLIDNLKTQLAELEWRIYEVLNDYLPDVY